MKKNADLSHTDNLKVTSHIQREVGEWIINTLMIEGYEVPFRFKRKQSYKDLNGARVNLTYYRDSEKVAGFDVEVMNIVRIRKS